MDRVFPDAEWARLAPEAAGFSAARLANVESWLRGFAGEQPFRLVIARYGYLVAEWTRGIDPEAGIRFHSASKSVYSSLLGIAVAEGRLPGIDARGPIWRRRPRPMRTSWRTSPRTPGSTGWASGSTTTAGYGRNCRATCSAPGAPGRATSGSAWRSTWWSRCARARGPACARRPTGSRASRRSWRGCSMRSSADAAPRRRRRDHPSSSSRRP